MRMAACASIVLAATRLAGGVEVQDAHAVIGPIAHVYATAGGWVMGEAAWAFPHARHFAERGMIVFAVQYRLSDQDSITPLEAMADARAAIFDDSLSARAVSPVPNAIVMVSPAVSLRSDGWVGRILQGDIDTVTPLAGARRFCERLRALGNRCELHVYEGFGHIFTPAGVRDDGMSQPDPATSKDATRRADLFLEALGYME